jgi:ribonuclease Z
MSLDLVNLINKNAERIGNRMAAKVTIDIQDYHTPIPDIVRAAQEANVGHLVFYHHLPAPRNQLMENIMYRGVDGIMKNWTASHDGTMLVLPIYSTDVTIISSESIGNTNIVPS